MSVIKLWWLSLGIFVAVVGVVAGLLGLIITTAQSIDRRAADIWTVGKQIAGNTVSIWMLEKTNDNLGEVRDAALSLNQTATSMDEKLRVLAGSGGDSKKG